MQAFTAKLRMNADLNCLGVLAEVGRRAQAKASASMVFRPIKFWNLHVRKLQAVDIVQHLHAKPQIRNKGTKPQPDLSSALAEGSK